MGIRDIPPYSLLDAQDAIVATLREEFAARGFVCGLYQPEDDLGEAESIQTPFLLLSNEGMEFVSKAPNLPPSGRMWCRVNFAIHAVLSMQTDRTQAELDACAYAVMACVMKQDARHERGNMWGIGFAAYPVESCSTSRGSIQLNGRDSRRIAWQQTFLLIDDLSVLLQ